MIYARISDGAVLEVVDLADINPVDVYHVDIANTFVPATKKVKAGWTYDGETFAAPVVAAKTADELRAYASAKRFAVETGGIVVNGARIDTSRDSQSMVANAHAYIVNSGAASTAFKSLSGWMTLSGAEIKATALAVGAHVQASFVVEKAIDALITSGEITEIAEIDAFQWPSDSSAA
ncbi:DUF4376 domain-containing protein [Agrobacterium sp. ICMP 6402]|uniref:DUF4376 domain-containing protein n=1 Tax=Agrobacterium sp. ICMP 6402 TaxID=2292443 RepID=UPI0012950F22|nr:DUF4376 domain-containing protein [Agrobacterium sp. ICMP 6402]MQB09510.1 DUF4376 domain-containing protein [Agrobacterium sp. ICMP 6402]